MQRHLYYQTQLVPYGNREHKLTHWCKIDDLAGH